MPHPKNHLRATGGKFLKTGLVRFAVRRTVAIAGDRAVLLINNGDVNRLLMRLVFLRHPERLGPDESVAARHPSAGLALSEHDGIEKLAVVALHPDHAAALLVEATQLQPRLERLGAQGRIERRGLDPRVTAIHHQRTALKSSVSLGRAVQRAEAVLKASIKFPAGKRRGRLRLLLGVTMFALGERRFAGAVFDPGKLLAQRRNLFSQHLALSRQLRVCDAAFAVKHPGDRRGHLVIFLLLNGIELVIVAARAVDREPDKRLPDRANNLLDFILARRFFHELAATDDCVVQPGHEKTDRLLAGRIARLEHIAGNLHPHKFIIRHVVVQRADHPVAIRP